jgi:glycosyltransferase involved in cell wall biosynthesis
MKIWIFNHYAEPPDRLTTRSYDLGRQLVERGHRVTIFAAGFSHYNFREERVPAGQASHTANWNGVRFIWLKTYPYRGNDWRRMLNMLSYAWRAYKAGRIISEKPDVIIGVSVHPLAPLAAYFLSRTKAARFFFEVTDLWPETLIQFGRLRRSGCVARAMGALERFLYRKAERIIMLLGNTQEYVADVGADPSKIVWIPNGVDLSRYTKLRPYDGALSDRFTIMYLGGLLSANKIDVILEAARIQQERERSGVQFVFVGDGADKQRLLERTRVLGLRNIEFRGLVPKDKIAEVMSEADAFVFSLQNLPLYRYGISLNKMCDYLASGRPILFAGDSVCNPIRQAEAGLCVPAEDPTALADAIDKLISLTAEARVRMGQNGLVYLKQHHDIRRLAERLEETLLAQPKCADTLKATPVVSDLKSLS